MAIDQIKKCAELALYQTAILNDEITRLQEAVQQQKKKKLQDSRTILTGTEGRRRTPDQKQSVEEGDGDIIVSNTSAKNMPGKL
ncbi:uncharacterized protein V1513DRAFT_455671 [Lipomyces chichibuensis]|uniref:uncharacterized protein n=1 Tax=Lipomyces chichibuensis TaxID=1546026 RepID=UPI00334369E5